MRSLRYPRFWLLPGILWLLLLCFGSLVAIPSDMNLPNDKLRHLVAYAILVYSFGCALQKRWLPAIVAMAVATGLVLEILQGQTGYRAFEWGDVLANTLGAVLGALLATTVLGNLYRWLEDLRHV